MPANISFWKRLRRKRSAILSTYFIAFVCVLGIFAYPLAPDSSPNANRQLSELEGRPPGFSSLFLLQPRKQPSKKSFLLRLFTGTPPRYNLIPISSFFFARDTIVVQHYLGRGKSEMLSFPIKSILPTQKRRLDLGRQQLYIFNHHIERRTFILGTDSKGRDILSRVLVGIRVSLGISIAAVVLSFTIGILLGVFLGYYRGGIAAIVMYLINTLWAIPSLLLVFGITLGLGRGLWQVALAIGLTMGVSTTRHIREQVGALREMEFTKAAKTLGFSDIRIIIRHILPNLAGSLGVIAISSFAAAILIEAGLSFLGIGIQPPVPSWGLMIREHAAFLLTGTPIMTLLPGIAVLLLSCAFNTLANALRHLQDVKKSN